MPKGQNPRASSLARIGMLETQLKKATTQTKLQRVKTLLKAYTVGVSQGPEETTAVKKLRSQIEARQKSLLKNSNKIPSKETP